jgi:hypothetical protein
MGNGYDSDHNKFRFIKLQREREEVLSKNKSIFKLIYGPYLKANFC